MPATADQPVLVFGDDGSAAADLAWSWICDQDWSGWDAEVLRVTDQPFPPTAASVVQPQEWAPPEPRVAPGSARLRIVRSLTVAQDPRLALGAVTHAALVVVAPGRTERVLLGRLGSTTEWLLQHPVVPLLVARDSARVRRVLVCVDGSTHARAAVAAFTSLPWAGSTRVDVLVVDDGRTPSNAWSGSAAAALAATGAGVDERTAVGRPTKAIMSAIEAEGYELVVLGTRGLTGWQRLRVGSTASQVVRSASCSVLVACADDDA
jgi:nucleotide-binding universal stress UspA family protein